MKHNDGNSRTSLRRIVLVALIVVVMVSTVPMTVHASSSPTFTPPKGLQMGQFMADPEVAGGNASALAEWFSMSWGINQAYQVGATDHHIIISSGTSSRTDRKWCNPYRWNSQSIGPK